MMFKMLNESATVDVSSDGGDTPEYGNMETIFSESKISLFRYISLYCCLTWKGVQSLHTMLKMNGNS